MRKKIVDCTISELMEGSYTLHEIIEGIVREIQLVGIDEKVQSKSQPIGVKNSEVGENLEYMISSILLELGAKTNIKGYGYAKEAIEMIYHNPKISITKELYPAIAEKHNDRWQRVERAIRHLVESTFDNIQPCVMEKYFGNSVSYEKGKPTNKEFFTTLAEYLHMICK